MIKFTAQDKSALAAWLETGEFASSAMPIIQLEGYLFALVCAPLPIEEDSWVVEVLGDDVTELAEDKLFALMAYHNAISDKVFESGYRVSDYIDVAVVAGDNLSQSSDLHLWSAGFSLGIAHYIEKIVTAEKLSEELSEALAMTLGYLCFFANLENDASLSEAVIDALDDFSEGFASLIEASVINAEIADDNGFDELD